MEWTGNRGDGTRTYTSYGRDHVIRAEGKPPVPGSSDPLFRGDAARYNPEELLLAALSACHMLWYLHLCSDAGVEVVAYADAPTGTVEERPDGAAEFAEVTLHPEVTVASGDLAAAEQLHDRAREKCWIARSMNFPVRHEPHVVRAAAPPVAARGT